MKKIIAIVVIPLIVVGICAYIVLKHEDKIMDERSDHRCGPQYDNAKCGTDRCCSSFGWCGKTKKHCEKSEGCIAQCKSQN